MEDAGEDGLIDRAESLRFKKKKKRTLCSHTQLRGIKPLFIPCAAQSLSWGRDI